MLDNSSLAESDVTAEVERYIVWPGQALGYKLGQLHISALRAKAEPSSALRSTSASSIARCCATAPCPWMC